MWISQCVVVVMIWGLGGWPVGECRLQSRRKVNTLF